MASSRKQAEARVREKLAARNARKAAGVDVRAGIEHLTNHTRIGTTAATDSTPPRMRSALGFEYESETAGRHAQFIRDYIPYIAKRSARWAEEYPVLSKCNGRYLPDPEAKLKRSAKLQRFIRKGIPNDLRPHVWMEVSGAGKKLVSNRGYYDNMVQSQGVKWEEQISLDIPRTFPNNLHFCKTGSKYQVLLHRLLLAYSNHKPEIGYCQGMNYVAGMLLLVMGGNEEYAFWLFDALVEQLPKDLYKEDMKGIQAECSTFVSLLESEFPQVAEALRVRGALEVMPAIAVKWFINAYVDTVPEETVLRIWDTVFYDGWKVIYRVGFAILVNAHKTGELLTHDSNSILEFLGRIGWSAFDCNVLLEQAFDDVEVKKRVPQRKIESVRKKEKKKQDRETH